MPEQIPLVTLAEQPVLHFPIVAPAEVRAGLGFVSAERAVMELGEESSAAVQARLAEAPGVFPEGLEFLRDFGQGVAEGSVQSSWLDRDLARATPARARLLGAWTTATALDRLLQEQRAAVAYEISDEVRVRAADILATQAAAYVAPDREAALAEANRLYYNMAARDEAAEFVAQGLTTAEAALPPEAATEKAMQHWHTVKSRHGADADQQEGRECGPYVTGMWGILVDERLQQSSAFVQRIVAGAEASLAAEPETNPATTTALDRFRAGAERAMAWVATATAVYAGR
ncbi:MAG TPA: hypothetical protein VLF71_01645 [Candidatus Saccharimonadales bacterium]|nr:hypothetical protein [Candidatus Saccharimonadales bacterium]